MLCAAAQTSSRWSSLCRAACQNACSRCSCSHRRQQLSQMQPRRTKACRRPRCRPLLPNTVALSATTCTAQLQQLPGSRWRSGCSSPLRPSRSACCTSPASSLAPVCTKPRLAARGQLNGDAGGPHIRRPGVAAAGVRERRRNAAGGGGRPPHQPGGLERLPRRNGGGVQESANVTVDPTCS